MEDTLNKRRSTRTAGALSQTVPSSATIKKETHDAYGFRGQTRQPIMGSFQEASSSNSNDDPLAVEVDIGGTSITFHDSYYNVRTDYIKTEGLAADEIEDIDDAVGSSTKRRKTMEEEDSGDDLELARAVQQPAAFGSVLFNDDPLNVIMNDAGSRSSNSMPQSSATMEGQGINDAYVIKMVNHQSNVATKQAQPPKERLKVLTPTILNSNMNGQYSDNTATSTQTLSQSAKHGAAAKAQNCTHCVCFVKFVSDHNRKVDQFLVKQQKVVNDMFKMQQIIMEKLQRIETNLENQTKQLQPATALEQPEEADDRTLLNPNDFIQLQYVEHEPTQHEEQDQPPQHQMGGEYSSYSSEEVQLFSFSRMQSEEELNEFENRLGDSEYFKEAYNWLNSLIMETNCGNRMLTALDLLFDKVFVNRCSWTGRGKANTRKAPIRCRRNLLQLFKAIGSTRKAIVSHADVEFFFIKKLKQSKQRLKIQGIRKASCHTRRVNVD